jgi:hypothetical protein
MPDDTAVPQQTAQQASAAQPAGKRLDPGLKRNLLIIGAVVGLSVVGVGLMLMSRTGSSGANQGPAGVGLPSASPAGTPTTEPTSPMMQQLLREQQQAEADAARRAGRPYIPPDSAATEPLPNPAATTPDSRLGNVPGVQPTPVVLSNPGVLTPEEQMARDRARRGLEVQLRDMLSANTPPREIVRIQVAPQQQGAAAPTGASTVTPAAPAVAAPTSSQAQAAGPALVDALEIFAATTLTPVDTYQTGYISARIVSGRLAGAFLVGRTQMVNEGLQPRFTQMRLGGKTYAIDAIALDEASGTDSVRADLDRRYLQRYVMPVVVAMVGGYTASRAQTGSQVVGIGTDGTGGVGITQPAPTEKQAVYAGVSQAMSITQRAVDQEAALPIRASLPAGTAIGVMFNAPVADVDATREAAQEAARAANAARRDTQPAVVSPVQAAGRQAGVGQAGGTALTGLQGPTMQGSSGVYATPGVPATRVPGLPGSTGSP